MQTQWGWKPHLIYSIFDTSEAIPSPQVVLLIIWKTHNMQWSENYHIMNSDNLQILT